MLLWVLFAVMTAAVLAGLLRPLWRAQTAATPAVAADVAVYRQQLAEIDADRTRGLIDGAEAETARREVARRLLASAEAASQPRAIDLALAGRVATGLAAVLPAAALGCYLMLGAPQIAGRPSSERARTAAEQAPLDELVARIEARLAANPDDGQGWDVIAPVYFRLDRFDQAAAAFARALALLGDSTPRLAGFAESTVMANNGIVTEAARLAYEKLATREPSRIEPKFWLALALEQDGKLAEAATAYRALLAAAPPEATWKPLIEERLMAIAHAAARTGRPAPAAPRQTETAAPRQAEAAAPRGPTADDVKAAEQMGAKERGQMISGMVDGLAKRLEANPQDAQGWRRLVQSYVVLGERDKATRALNDARRHLAGNTEALAELAALAKSLGLGS
jgi:cytochrome c-type biogenesis protein CcmH